MRLESPTGGPVAVYPGVRTEQNRGVKPFDKTGPKPMGASANLDSWTLRFGGLDRIAAETRQASVNEALDDGLRYLHKQDYAQANLHFSQAHAMVDYDRILDRIQILNHLGITTRKLGKPEEAHYYLKAAKTLAHQVEDEHPFLLLVTLNHLGDLYLNTGDTQEAMAYYQQWLDRVAALKPAESPEAEKKMQSFLSSGLINANLSVGFIHLQEGRLDAAIQSFENALDATLKKDLNGIIPNVKQPIVVTIQNYLAEALLQAEKPQQALSYSEEAMDTARALYGETSEALIPILSQQADILENLGEFAQAKLRREEAERLNAQ